MTGIMVLAGILVSVAVAVALVTSHELDMIRRELARLEQEKNLTYARLEETIEHKKAAEGTRVMLKKLRHSKKQQLDQYLVDLDEIASESDEDYENRDISLSKPLQNEGTPRK